MNLQVGVSIRAPLRVSIRVPEKASTRACGVWGFRGLGDGRAVSGVAGFRGLRVEGSGFRVWG